MDGVGRVVIPKEIRNTFNIQNEDPIEILIDEEKIILKKYIKLCTFCKSTEGVIRYKIKNICQECVRELKLFL